MASSPSFFRQRRVGQPVVRRIFVQRFIEQFLISRIVERFIA